MKREPLNFPLTEFPHAFQEDIKIYIRNKGLHPDFCVASDNRVERARRRIEIKETQQRKREIEEISPRTIKSHIDTIHFIASAAIRIGILKIDEIQSICDVADISIINEQIKI